MRKEIKSSEFVEPAAGLPKELQQKLLGSVVEFMTQSGVSEASITQAFRLGLKQSRNQKDGVGVRDGVGRYPSSGDVSAHLLRLWHRDHRFTDNAYAKPRPLYLSKGRYSLRRLLLSLDPQANVASVLKVMRSMGLIRRTKDGRYLPAKNAAVVSGLHPWAMEHAAKSVVRFVTTVLRNANSDSKSPPLLERYSYVPDLNPSEAMAFAEFARSQGQAYLDVLDDWLEQRRVVVSRQSRSASRKGLAAGVHLITYLGDCDSEPLSDGVSQLKRAEASLQGSKRRRKRSSASPPRAKPS